MKTKNWVTEGTVPSVNRFEIRLGGWSTMGYGAELIVSRHNNPISVVIEIARLQARAKKLDMEYGLSCLPRRQDTLYRYQVVERVEHVSTWQEDSWPAQVIHEERWETEKHYGLGHFSWVSGFLRKAQVVDHSLQAI